MSQKQVKKTAHFPAMCHFLQNVVYLGTIFTPEEESPQLPDAGVFWVGLFFIIKLACIWNCTV